MPAGAVQQLRLYWRPSSILSLFSRRFGEATCQLLVWHRACGSQPRPPAWAPQKSGGKGVARRRGCYIFPSTVAVEGTRTLLFLIINPLWAYSSTIRFFWNPLIYFKWIITIFWRSVNNLALIKQSCGYFDISFLHLNKNYWVTWIYIHISSLSWSPNPTFKVKDLLIASLYLRIRD